MNKCKKLFTKLFPYIFVSLLTILPLTEILIKNNNTILFKYKYIIYIITILITCVLFIFLEKSKLKFELKYILLFLIIGIVYMFFIPLGQVPDEKTHFLRAYEISEGHLLSDKGCNGGGGRNLPSNISNIFNDNEVNYNYVLSTVKYKVNKERKFFYFPNTAVYNFVCYVPQSLGILIGRILNLPLTVDAYLGRFLNFIVTLFLMYLTLKLIPIKKMLVVLLMFIPMIFQEAISLAPDALTNAIAFLFISYILKIKYEKNYYVNNNDLICLSFLTIIMSLCKIIYLPICLSLFMISKEKFKNVKVSKYKFIGILVLVTIVINGTWLVISSSYLNSIKENVMPNVQLKYVIKHPLSFFKVICNSLYLYSDLYLFNIIGSYLSYFNVKLSFLYVFLYLIIILYYMILDNDKSIDMKDKYLPIFIMISTVFLMALSLYIQWNPVANKFIDGIQGRYFIPLLLFSLVIINNKNNVVKGFKYNVRLINCSIVVINVYALIELFVHFF